MSVNHPVIRLMSQVVSNRAQFWDLCCFWLMFYITQDIQCPYKAFADDYKLYLKFSRNDKPAVTNYRPAFKGLWTEWTLNPKCVVMRFRRGVTANQASAEYFLRGVRLQCVHAHDLNWESPLMVLSAFMRT